MTANTLAARETVREIRESLSRQEPALIELSSEFMHAFGQLTEIVNVPIDDDYDWERVELWARLAADLASMIQQKEKAL